MGGLGALMSMQFERDSVWGGVTQTIAIAAMTFRHVPIFNSHDLLSHIINDLKPPFNFTLHFFIGC